jgi:hypothetical protein
MPAVDKISPLTTRMYETVKNDTVPARNSFQIEEFRSDMQKKESKRRFMLFQNMIVVLSFPDVWCWNRFFPLSSPCRVERRSVGMYHGETKRKKWRKLHTNTQCTKLLLHPFIASERAFSGAHQKNG